MATRRRGRVLPAGRQGSNETMFYVYILKSLKDGKMYIGKTNDVNRRLKEHNYGHTLSTKSRAPFKLLKSIQCETEEQARVIEKEYKKGYKREEIKREFRDQ